jgi:hypothetical protein
MFIEIVKNIQTENKTDISSFIYYFERHIEVDSYEHGPLALEMIEELCGKDDQKWNEALSCSKKAMQLRIKLWDGIFSKISSN